MSEILSKISSYNIINYIIPGGIFYYVLSEINLIKTDDTNLLVLIFLIYFIGMTLSRVGSLIVEPVLNISGFIKSEPYHDYLYAASKDPKIEILMESSALYRTLFTGFLLVFLYKLSEALFFRGIDFFESIYGNNNWLIIFLTGIYLFSYKKQVKYVIKRVQNHRNNS